jgi:hypothetical protein
LSPSCLKFQRQKEKGKGGDPCTKDLVCSRTETMVVWVGKGIPIWLITRVFCFIQCLVFCKGFRNHEGNNNKLQFNHHFFKYLLYYRHCDTCFTIHPCLKDTNSCSQVPAMTEGCIGENWYSWYRAITIYQALS